MSDIPDNLYIETIKKEVTDFLKATVPTNAHSKQTKDITRALYAGMHIATEVTSTIDNPEILNAVYEHMRFKLVNLCAQPDASTALISTRTCSKRGGCTSRR